ncbi:MAG: LytR C-terminal domain-containing protein, partial [Bacteroidetes bacterium]|nr:LytR C-terminal domain-containing protein [Bacteroidota bacterium]
MKILSNNKTANYIFMSALGILVVLMISSFAIRMFNPPISSELEDIASKTNEIENFIQVNVFNACGKDGLAKHVKEYLIQRGFDVVEIANYPENVDNSMVIDRIGDSLSTNKVAYAMGIEKKCITMDIDSSQFVRSTIVIGKDYFTLK